jgi:hypothetical protein
MTLIQLSGLTERAWSNYKTEEGNLKGLKAETARAKIRVFNAFHEARRRQRQYNLRLRKENKFDSGTSVWNVEE